MKDINYQFVFNYAENIVMATALLLLVGLEIWLINRGSAYFKNKVQMLSFQTLKIQSFELLGIGKFRAVPPRPDIDEGGVQPLVHRGDAAEINVPGQAFPTRPGNKNFHQPPVRQQRRPGFPRRCADQDMVDGHRAIPNGGLPRLSAKGADGVAHALRCPASLQRTLLAENLGKPSLGVIISDPWYYPLLKPAPCSSAAVSESAKPTTLE